MERELSISLQCSLTTRTCGFMKHQLTERRSCIEEWNCWPALMLRCRNILSTIISKCYKQLSAHDWLSGSEKTKIKYACPLLLFDCYSPSSTCQIFCFGLFLFYFVLYLFTLSMLCSNFIVYTNYQLLNSIYHSLKICSLFYSVFVHSLSYLLGIFRRLHWDSKWIRCVIRLRQKVKLLIHHLLHNCAILILWLKIAVL